MHLLRVSDTHIAKRAIRCPVRYGLRETTQTSSSTQRIPEAARVDLYGLRLAVIHDSGPATGCERCEELFPDKALTSRLALQERNDEWVEIAGYRRYRLRPRR